MNCDSHHKNNNKINKLNLNKDNTYSLDYNVDAEKIYEFLKTREPENAHQVKPVYIKKIGVELDKKSN